ncbi:MAG TPA: ferredoxin family protein [Polyangiaceae bacterium]|jgi:MinD superfamily P-loop ATPase|nr:ferredoxin family protein [Polyangiaceae bacterium]
MIELVSEERCIQCDVCVDVCPTNVFDPVEGGPPVIARKADCQTCFMCEVYCPADAMYVSPNSHANVAVNEAELAAGGVLGSYRRAVGWGPKRTPGASKDATFRVIDSMKRHT